MPFPLLGMGSLPSLPPTPAVVLLSVSWPLLVISAARSFWHGLAVFKILCSTAFLSGPILDHFEPISRYHMLVTTGLLLSFAGDVCLIPSADEANGGNTGPTSLSSRPGRVTPSETNQQQQDVKVSTGFMIGVLAFAGAHISYIMAFLQDADGVSWLALTTTFGVSMATAGALGILSIPLICSPERNPLGINIPLDMRPLVSIYAIIISTMLGVSGATSAISSSWPRQRLLGAMFFVISDVFVAQDAFGKMDAPLASGRLRISRHRWIVIALGYGFYFWGQMILAGTLYE